MINRKSQFASFIVFAGILGIGANVQPADAYSVYRSGKHTNIILDTDLDIGRRLDPIRSKSASNPFRLTLTLNSAPIKKNGANYASFNFEVENLSSDRHLTGIKINPMKRKNFNGLYSLKNNYGNGAAGLDPGKSIEFTADVRLGKIDTTYNTFHLRRITTNWWSDAYGDQMGVKTVPEPLTVVGTFAALGFGAWFRRKKR